MSTLKADTLVALDGTSPVTLTKQSAAKAWVDKPQNGASINASFNISSLDDDGVGNYGLNFVSSMSSVYYAVLTGADDNTASDSVIGNDTTNGTITASGVDLETFYVTAADYRTDYDTRAFVSINGDLA